MAHGIHWPLKNWWPTTWIQPMIFPHFKMGSFEFENQPIMDATDMISIFFFILFNSIQFIFFFLHILYKSEWENNKSLSIHIKKLSHTWEKWKENQTHHQMSMNTEYICIKSEKISNKPTNWFNWSHHYNFKYKRYWFQQFQTIKCKWNSIGCLCCVWQWVKLAMIITIKK